MEGTRSVPVTLATRRKLVLWVHGGARGLSSWGAATAAEAKARMAVAAV